MKLVVSRSEEGKNFGVVLVPEGLIEFIPEVTEWISCCSYTSFAVTSCAYIFLLLLLKVGALIEEINEILSKPDAKAEANAVASQLTSASAQVFAYLPAEIKLQLLLDRDAHGNVAVSKIETERLLCSTLETELAKLKKAGSRQPVVSLLGSERKRACTKLKCNVLNERLSLRQVFGRVLDTVPFLRLRRTLGIALTVRFQLLL